MQAKIHRSQKAIQEGTVQVFHSIDAVLKELGEDTEEAQSDDSLD